MEGVGTVVSHPVWGRQPEALRYLEKLVPKPTLLHQVTTMTKIGLFISKKLLRNLIIVMPFLYPLNAHQSHLPSLIGV